MDKIFRQKVQFQATKLANSLQIWPTNHMLSLKVLELQLNFFNCGRCTRDFVTASTVIGLVFRQWVKKLPKIPIPFLRNSQHLDKLHLAHVVLHKTLLKSRTKSKYSFAEHIYHIWMNSIWLIGCARTWKAFVNIL